MALKAAFSCSENGDPWVASCFINKWHLWASIALVGLVHACFLDVAL